MTNDINIVNKLFYKYAESDLLDRLPNLYVSLELFHEALYVYISSDPAHKKIRIKELACGKDPGIWKTFIDRKDDREWEVTLTDFNARSIPRLDVLKTPDNFEINSGSLDLFKPLDRLEQKYKYDYMLSFYTFDNVWLDADTHLIKRNGRWFKNVFNIIIPLSLEKKLQKDQKLGNNFFKRIKIEQSKVKFNISELEFGSLIEKYYSGIDKCSFNYPGGMIYKLIESFDKQIKADGAFITSDLAMTDKKFKSKPFKKVLDCLNIKVENYGLAKYILESLGYKVELRDLYSFIKENGIDTPVEIYDHFVLVVKKINDKN